ncbi:MAG TPA: glycine cleavage T C-terminal barrel domain-containing protein [Candidatus Dormibacteraeota bacterium]|nr:glycine cleavage T C-terminal barrel domain-containing protein [Candidatus Dormibacteraeota bacterium]
MRIEGDVAGRVTSGGYCYTAGRSIAYAYVPARPVAMLMEVDLFGRSIGGRVAKESRA